MTPGPNLVPSPTHTSPLVLRWHVQTHVCFYMRTLGAGVRRTAYALHARGLRLCRLLLGYASVLMSCIGILYYKCILYSVFCIPVRRTRRGGGVLVRGDSSSEARRLGGVQTKIFVSSKQG